MDESFGSIGLSDEPRRELQENVIRQRRMKRTKDENRVTRCDKVRCVIVGLCQNKNFAAEFQGIETVGGDTV